ncbi:hypothetical protein DCC84_24415 [Pseudomonas sp. SXM-1]|nr:hypothetical protein DCC84_24415 [Pseudomonas sp. SXM-1]
MRGCGWSVSLASPDGASSRASPLPHLTEYIPWNAVECGSGLARESGLKPCAPASNATRLRP